MSDDNQNENVGDLTEAGVVDATSPEGERTEGSGRTDDLDERAQLSDGVLSPVSTAKGGPTEAADPAANEHRPHPTGPSQHNPDALVEGNRVAGAHDME